jgi:hypothetical protein
MWRRENSWPYRESNSDPSVIQSVASRYPDYVIPAPECINTVTAIIIIIIISTDSAAGIATGCGLYDRVIVRSRIFHIVHTGSGSHLASYLMDTGSSFPGIKRPGREDDH